MDQKILKALETWYGGDGLEARINMALSLVGEMGEVTNLYRKMFFKPGYEGLERNRALDELGDLWYYIRIFAYLSHQVELDDLIKGIQGYNSSILHRDAIINILVNLHHLCLEVEEWALQQHYSSVVKLLGDLILQLSFLLRQWECSLDELTELNYQKLTKNVDHHGWKSEVPPMMQDDYKEKYLGFDYAEEGSKGVIGIWKKGDNREMGYLGATPLTPEAFEELKKKMSECNFKLRYENQPLEMEKVDKEGNWSEYDQQREIELAADMIKKQLEKEEREFILGVDKDLEELDLRKAITTGHDEPENSELKEEDWREAMQKRIRANEQRSRELRGRWY